jgi:metal-responsive CopG/Arc/MetJ family transcriptional regulator
MASIKTAISINKNLFEQVNKLAGELEVSRSYLFVLAVEEFIQRYENERLLRQINQAYDDLPLADENQILRGMRSSHRKLVDGEW